MVVVVRETVVVKGEVVGLRTTPELIPELQAENWLLWKTQSQPVPMLMAVSVAFPGEVRAAMFIPFRLPAAGPEVVGATMLIPFIVPPVTIAPETGIVRRIPSAVIAPSVWVILGRLISTPRQSMTADALFTAKSPAAEKLKPLKMKSLEFDSV